MSRWPFTPSGGGKNTLVLPTGPLQDGLGVPPPLRRALPLPEVQSFHFAHNWRTDATDIYVRWELLGRQTTTKINVENPMQLDDELWWREQQVEAARHMRNEASVKAKMDAFATSVKGPHDQTR